MLHSETLAEPIRYILQDSEFMSANKMFEEKVKLFTKEKTMENQNTNHLLSKETCRNRINTSWTDRTRTAFGKMRRSKLRLFGFLCVFILLAAAEIVNKKKFYLVLV